MNTDFNELAELLLEIAVRAVKWHGRDATQAHIDVMDEDRVRWMKAAGGIATLWMLCDDDDRKEMQNLLCEMMYGYRRADEAGRDLAFTAKRPLETIIKQQAERFLPDAVRYCIADGTLGRYRKLTETGELR